MGVVFEDTKPIFILISKFWRNGLLFTSQFAFLSWSLNKYFLEK
jgi:hypothetical protein